MSRLKADEMFSNQATQGNTALNVHHHSDSDYNTGVPFALSNGGVKFNEIDVMTSDSLTATQLHTM